MNEERNAGCAKCNKYSDPVFAMKVKDMVPARCNPKTTRTWDVEYGYSWNVEDFSKNENGDCPLFEMKKDPVREAFNALEETEKKQKSRVKKIAKFLVTNVLVAIAMLAALLAILTLTGCTEEPCETENALQCDGTKVDQCRNSEWEEMIDCHEVIGDGWTCCDIEGVVSCYEVIDCKKGL